MRDTKTNILPVYQEVLYETIMMFILITAVFCLSWYFILSWRRRDVEELYKRIPKISTRRLLLIGHLHTLLGNEEVKMQKLIHLGREATTAGGIAGIWLLHRLYIIVADSEVADILMKNCLEKDDSMHCFHIVTHDGSIFSSVEKWWPRRKFLAPTFHMKYLLGFSKAFSKHSGHIVEKIKREIATGADTMRMDKIYMQYTMNSILGSLGMRVKMRDDVDHPLLLALEDVMSALITRALQPWLYSDWLYKLTPRYREMMRHVPVVFEMFHKEIQAKRREIEKISDNSNKGVGNMDLKTFIDLMIQSPTNMNDVTIREECVVLFSAASDTTAVSLGYITLMLARYPEEQDKIYDELKEVMGDLSRPVTPEDLPRLKYLDAFIRETLRLYPPVPLIVRKTVKNIELPSGETLVPGCGIAIHIWAINRNPVYWGEDAEQFRPARFLEPTERHPAAFVAFSHGPRNCLGKQYAMMSLKTVVATILSQFRVEAASEELKHQPLRVEYDLMMRHMDNYRVRFNPR